MRSEKDDGKSYNKGSVSGHFLFSNKYTRGMVEQVHLEKPSSVEDSVVSLVDFKNKVRTWDDLRKRGWSGPRRCALYGVNEEYVNHLFVFCHFFQFVWSVVMQSLNILGVWLEELVEQSPFHWLCDIHSNSFKYLPLHI